MDSEQKTSEPLYEFLAWLEVNKKRVAIGGSAVLGVAGILALTSWYKGQNELNAAHALAEVRVPYYPGEPMQPGTVEKLQNVAAQYSGTAAGARAELTRAGLLFAEAKYAEAQAAFENFIKSHPESAWMAEAVYGVAVCLDAQKKATEAAAKYEDFTRRYPTDPNVDQARLHLATLFESTGKPAQALEQYDKIVKAMSYTPAAQEAQERLRQLLAKNPQLIPTNAIAPKPGLSGLRTNPPIVIRTNVPLSSNAAPIKATVPAAK